MLNKLAQPGARYALPGQLPDDGDDGTGAGDAKEDVVAAAPAQLANGAVLNDTAQRPLMRAVVSPRQGTWGRLRVLVQKPPSASDEDVLVEACSLLERAQAQLAKNAQMQRELAADRDRVAHDAIKLRKQVQERAETSSRKTTAPSPKSVEDSLQLQQDLAAARAQHDRMKEAFDALQSQHAALKLECAGLRALGQQDTMSSTGNAAARLPVVSAAVPFVLAPTAMTEPAAAATAPSPADFRYYGHNSTEDKADVAAPGPMATRAPQFSSRSDELQVLLATSSEASAGPKFITLTELWTDWISMAQVCLASVQHE